MKTSLLLLCFSLFIVNNMVYGQQAKAKKQPAKNAATKFLGKWRGPEICSDISAPVALIYATGSGQSVTLTGVYSLQGQIQATVKGDTLFIARQEVKDPNFMNVLIEGKLGFGTNPFNLSGSITVINNQKKDECLVKYYR